ncbi:predicted protein [Plenodomus lingam JN3]|uniref:Predicted protein n=1 Tax=Leptosphaeria maculans (strain JN3 / isolate v23.1.3 / race Av1-4-5-6-7-8) TaxID=985895 RepID=E5AAN9_LEPMJ|nr:predicted protein [Plenodomus lingam JN3]CBY00730.1 predicted protein [Plenodomus lingam JN3]
MIPAESSSYNCGPCVNTKKHELQSNRPAQSTLFPTAAGSSRA